MNLSFLLLVAMMGQQGTTNELNKLFWWYLALIAIVFLFGLSGAIAAEENTNLRKSKGLGELRIRCARGDEK